MKLPFPSKDDLLDDEFLDEEEFDDEPEESAGPYRLRAEVILAALALICTAVLLAIIAMSLPVFHKKPAPPAEPMADPQALLQSSHEDEESELKDAPILEEIPQSTTEPTIPPESNPYNEYDFQFNRDNYLICQKQDSYPGVDVSAFQHEIDWQQVADSGIRFAMIRLGFRGYGQAGKLVEDEYAKQNLKGAAEAGLSIGAYFFSQATNLEEVDGEIEFMLKTLGDTELQMPIVLDWEIPTAEARTAKVGRRTLTDCLLHYCQVMTEKGYRPMIYFNWGQSSRMLYLNELEDYPFWLALYQDRMTYPFRVEMWQYTCKGSVPGIQGDVDINVYMPDQRAKD